MPRIPTIRFDGQRLAALIEGKCLTRTQVAARAGVSASLVNRAVSGFTVSTLAGRAIAKALRVRLGDILAGDTVAVGA